MVIGLSKEEYLMSCASFSDWANEEFVRNIKASKNKYFSHN